MKNLRWVVALAVTACGSPVVQTGATTCPDGGDPLVCAAQQPWSPVATVLDGGAAVDASRPGSTTAPGYGATGGSPQECSKDKHCPAHHKCKQGVCKHHGGDHHDDDDDDDDDDCDD